MKKLIAPFALGLAPLLFLAAGAARPASPAAPAPATAAGDETPDPLTEIRAFIASKSIDKEDVRWRTKLPMPPKLRFAEDMRYLWKLETSEGPVTVEFLTRVAPMHVSSTIFLTELGFYDKLSFHRVITGFMAQGGCPLGTGSGGPGYKYAGEFSPKVKHDRGGLLSMANAGPGTDGSQFFLTFVPTPWLDGKHTIFGRVIDGMDTVKTLEKYGSQSGAPRKELSIVKATIAVEKVEKEADDAEGESAKKE